MSLLDQLSAYKANVTPILEYFSSRGISKESIQTFELGYCQDGSQFHGRLMIPICSPEGDLIGFGGRSLGDENPKYINSPESSVYKKGRVLYGLNLSQDFILESGTAIVVEGFFDVIGLWQVGIRNVVATCGTAFTKNQLRLLKRFAEEVVVCYDGDSAGRSAAERAIEGLASEKLPMRFVSMPSGVDPDEFVRINGRDAFLGLMEGIN